MLLVSEPREIRNPSVAMAPDGGFQQGGVFLSWLALQQFDVVLAFTIIWDVPPPPPHTSSP